MDRDLLGLLLFELSTYGGLWLARHLPAMRRAAPRVWRGDPDLLYLASAYQTAHGRAMPTTEEYLAGINDVYAEPAGVKARADTYDDWSKLNRSEQAAALNAAFTAQREAVEFKIKDDRLRMRNR